MSTADRDPRCGSCSHFYNEPGRLERAIAGWRSLGSAYGSTRADDGICELHDICVSARQCCARYRARDG